jgi:hypothetical protein
MTFRVLPSKQQEDLLAPVGWSASRPTRTGTARRSFVLFGAAAGCVVGV